MPANESESNHRAAAIKQPSLWLVAATAALLGGQGAATTSWFMPLEVGLVLLALLIIFTAVQRRWGLFLLFLIAIFSLGYVRHRQLLYPSLPPHHVRSLMNDSKLYLEGSLWREPEKLSIRTRWIFRAERLWHPTGAEETTGDILISLRSVRREWRYGDRIRFWLEPVVPRDSGNPGGFNFATYLADRAIYATGYLENDSEVELLARRPSFLYGAIESLRRQIRRYIDEHFSRERGALMKALVIGDMGEIPKAMRMDFTAAGVNHVLSISGLHVGMLGLVVFWLIRFGGAFSSTLLLRCNLVKIATLGSFFAVLFYTALAGAMVPTVRSAIMIGVYELAVLLDREEEVLTSLTFAALLIALFWPGVIMDISFQLSFSAVLFIAWGVRRARDWFPVRQSDALPQEQSWLKPKLRQAAFHLAVPFLATVGTGPLIAYYFGHLSLAGFLSNPLIVPLVGFVVVPLGLVIGFFSLVLPAAGLLLVWIAEHLTGLTLWLVQVLAKLPLANIGVPAPSLFEVGVLYFFFFSFLLLRRKRVAAILVAFMVAALAADGIYWWGERWRRKELRITHLNVGHGDAAVVELPGSKVLLIDAGGTASGEFDTGEWIVGPFLRSRKILKVDYLFVSHPRIDHYGGMRSIVREFSPVEFWSGPGKGKTLRFDDLEEALVQALVKRESLHNQTSCRDLEGVRVCVLYPAPPGTVDSSVVLRLEFGKARFLFAGDIDKRDERILQSQGTELQSSVLKVPRHGSATASSAEFVAIVQPKFAVFSASGGSSARQPRDEIVQRYKEIGAAILHTATDGAIIFRSDGQSLSFETYKSRRRGVVKF